MTTNNKPKKQHNASITVQCICWLQQHKDSFKDYTWKQALHRFNSENNAQLAPATFHEAASQLGIIFKTKIATRANKNPNGQAATSSVVLAKALRLLIKDIERALGESIASHKVNNVLTAIIGKKTNRELEEIIGDTNDTQ